MISLNDEVRNSNVKFNMFEQQNMGLNIVGICRMIFGTYL